MSGFDINLVVQIGTLVVTFWGVRAALNQLNNNKEKDGRDRYLQLLHRWSVHPGSQMIKQMMEVPISVISANFGEGFQDYFFDWSYECPYGVMHRSRLADNPLKTLLQWWEEELKKLEDAKSNKSDAGKIIIDNFLNMKVWTFKENTITSECLTIRQCLEDVTVFFRWRAGNCGIYEKNPQLIRSLKALVTTFQFESEQGTELPTILNLVGTYDEYDIIKRYKRLLITALYLMEQRFTAVIGIFRDRLDLETTSLNPKEKTILGYFDELFTFLSSVYLLIDKGDIKYKDIAYDMYFWLEAIERMVLSGFDETETDRTLLKDKAYYPLLLQYLAMYHFSVLKLLAARREYKTTKRAGQDFKPLKTERLHYDKWKLLIDKIVETKPKDEEKGQSYNRNQQPLEPNDYDSWLTKLYHDLDTTLGIEKFKELTTTNLKIYITPTN